MTFYSSLSLFTPLFMGALFVLAAFGYGFGHTKVGAHIRKWFGMKTLVRAAVYFRVAYAGLLTVLQYYVWSGMGAIGEVFLESPVSKTVPEPLMGKLSFLFGHQLGYFLFYSYGRFWLNVFITLIVAWVFHKALVALRKYNARFFDNGETELGYLMALIVGWPMFVVFLPLIFVFVILVALVRLIVMKEAYTTLGWPFIGAAAVCILAGAKLISLLHFGVLSI